MGKHRSSQGGRAHSHLINKSKRLLTAPTHSTDKGKFSRAAATTTVQASLQNVASRASLDYRLPRVRVRARDSARRGETAKPPGTHPDALRGTSFRASLLTIVDLTRVTNSIRHLVHPTDETSVDTQALATVNIATCPEVKAGHRRANSAADAYLKRGKDELALACYVAALSSKANFPPALYGIGETFAKKTPSGFELARESYELALKHWPEYVDARIALGDLWANSRGDRSRAESYYRGAVKTRPGDALAWESLAQNQVEDGRLDEALKTYDEAIEKVRDAPGLYYSRARVQEKRKRYEACVDDASAALKRATEFGQAYHVLAKCSAKLEGPDAPTESDLELYFRQAVKLEPEYAEHHLDLARFLYEMGGSAKLREARAVLDDALNGSLDEKEQSIFEVGARAFEDFVASRTREL